MSELKSIISIEFNNKKYTVASIKYSRLSENTIPILLDRDTYKIIKSYNKLWYINEKNRVYCIHNNNNKDYTIYIHELVMKLNKNERYINKPIIHINNIYFDNRIENLQFDTTNKDHSKNVRKKKRTINLKKYGINVNTLPTYLWYQNPDNTHGNRFIISISNEIFWKSTSSKRVSLRYKLEEAKKYLRYLKEERPDIFNDYSMNGDLTEKGISLYKEYYIMINRAGFTIELPTQDNTDKFLKKDLTGLSNAEVYLLYNFDPAIGNFDINKTLAEFYEMIDNYCT